MRTGLAILLSFQLCGCATIFRGPKSTIRVESSPAGAEAKVRVKKSERTLGATPAQLTVDRQVSTQIRLTKEGFEEHVGTIKKTMNGAWLALDVVASIPFLCVPILVDALTGAWFDVEPRYVGTMKPGSPSTTVAAAPAASSEAAAEPSAPAPQSSPPATMSEAERKAMARAAFIEGVGLQEGGKCIDALGRFEVAQRFYPAPTHLLHLGQCQAATGKLVEASETFETLARTPLTKESPEAFREAQDDGKKQLAQLRPRIPTLRIQTVPAANTLGSLVVKVNGNAMPNEVLGIARPVNPGRYRVTVWAAGYKEASSDVEIGEGAAKALDMKLAK